MYANLHPESLCNGKIIVVNQLMLQMTILFFFLGQIIKTSAAKYPFLFVTCFAKLFFHIACGKQHYLIQNPHDHTGLLLPDFLEV
jgi:hypothetical protein